MNNSTSTVEIISFGNEINVILPNIEYEESNERRFSPSNVYYLTDQVFEVRDEIRRLSSMYPFGTEEHDLLNHNKCSLTHLNGTRRCNFYEAAAFILQRQLEPYTEYPSRENYLREKDIDGMKQDMFSILYPLRPHLSHYLYGYFEWVLTH